MHKKSLSTVAFVILLATCDEGAYADSASRNTKDDLLNAEFRSAMKCIDDDQKPLLSGAQQAWLDYRDKQAAFDATRAAYFGKSDATARDEAADRISAKRIKEIDSIISECHKLYWKDFEGAEWKKDAGENRR
jgi:uncharacterized protein YecT (DUF1311 family)